MKFKGQIYQIAVETGSDLEEATDLKILFTKPNDSTGYFIGEASGTTLTYLTTASDIDQVGLWKFQAYVDGVLGDITTEYFGQPLI